MSDSPARAGQDTAAPRLWQRAVPVTLVAVAAAGVTLAFAGDSDEVRLSASRVAQPFVELALTDDVEQVCATDAARVRFSLTSHLVEAEELAWTVAVDPAGQRPEKVRATEDVRLTPEVTRAVSVAVDGPRRGAYDVVVRIADRPELLRVHCEGVR